MQWLLRLLTVGGLGLGLAVAAGSLERDFATPPEASRPWVYWMWMDGNLSRDGITADLEAMAGAGIGGVMIMEVDVGIPKGPVKFMSPEWRQLFKHVVAEAERLGIQVTLNAGPGWTGSGGPWVRPEQSMQHVVASAIEVTGPTNVATPLPQPEPRAPYFGTGGLPPEVVKAQREFYRDVAVLAFPTPVANARVTDSDEKALYLRHPISSMAGVKPFLPARVTYPELPVGAAVRSGDIVDLSDRLRSDGRLDWAVPAGRWTVLRFGRTSTGANTRPAPAPGLGLECDKFDRAALEAHFDQFVGSLLREIGPNRRRDAGWTSLHIDSWEMGAQNWTAAFRDEFRRRRGYDAVRYLPAVTGRVVENLEVTERFLWDLRQTAQELVLENHAQHLKELARREGLGLSIEPYDMNPTADLNLGAVADVPMCEFWANCFDTSYSCFEASSIAHTWGRPIVAAEAFTSDDKERWLLHPGSLKALGDWAFAAGVNRIVFHRYAHQPWLERWPGMTMGPYGVHWERTQTFWDMVGEYHRYLARCQVMLRKGETVADILYVTPEGAPHTFRPPASATQGQPPDRREFNFDACSPETLRTRGTVQGGKIVFPGGTSYRLLVLPNGGTMTPELLRRVGELVRAGATAVVAPPVKSPSLSGYPECDAELRRLASDLWGDERQPLSGEDRARPVAKGRLVWGGDLTRGLTEPPATGELLLRAKWIWFSEGKPAAAAPVGRRYFRRTLVLPAGEVESGEAVLTADNAFTLWVNGREAGAGDNFTQVRQFNITPLLRPGTNLLAVAADNGGDAPNPAGLIATVRIRMRGGQQIEIGSDSAWQAAASAGAGWPGTMSDVGWGAALELGDMGMAPWGRLTVAPPPVEIYPDYPALASWLRGDGAVPDFESDGPLRYTHRRDGETEIYFVANRNAAVATATASFRVTGKAPELWDPLTGSHRRAATWTERDGRTHLPLRFEPNGSLFVVFREPSRIPEPTAQGRNWDEVAVVTDLAGPWTVDFQPGRGAPASIELARLTDWAQHTDAGVRHFSGWGTYRRTFEWDPTKIAGGKPNSMPVLMLDLGQVAVMARVTLNGTDLGTVWTAPFRVPVGNALRVGENHLKVRVANLWPNRLIGDAGLPAEKRVGWTTWNPFRAGDTLLESGLLGPVRILAAETAPAGP